MSPNPIGNRVEQLAQSLAEHIVPLIVDAIDIDSILDKVDVEKIIERVDVDQIVERVDVQKIIDRVDVQQIIERVDINAIVNKIDIDSLVEQTELGSIIARSTTGILTEVLDVDPGAGGGVGRLHPALGQPAHRPGQEGPALARRARRSSWHPRRSHRHDDRPRPLARAHRRPPGKLRRCGQPSRRVRRRRRRLVGPLHPRRRAAQRRAQAGDRALVHAEQPPAGRPSLC